MSWVYIALAINSIGTIIAVAYALSSRQTAIKRKKRNKILRKRIAAAEAAARMSPREPVPPPPGKPRYAGSPIKPFQIATGGRAPWQASHVDLLPAADCDLSAFVAPVKRPDGPPPQATSHDINLLYHRLQRELRGRPGLALLNALTISYLRRNTEHTVKARTLFFRIWEERGDSLAQHLSPRWLVSTLRTFQEHGETEEQRLIGATGSLYGYMQRIYESERAMTGAGLDDAYVLETVPHDAFGFPGLVPVSATVNDSHNHIHAMLIEISQLDGGAGRVLEELLIQSYNAPNIFARADRERARILGADTGTQSPHWSFYHQRK